MATGNEKQQNLFGLTAQKADGLKQASFNKQVAMGATPSEALLNGYRDSLRAAIAPEAKGLSAEMQASFDERQAQENPQRMADQQAAMQKLQDDLQYMPPAALEQKYGFLAPEMQLAGQLQEVATQQAEQAPVDLSDVGNMLQVGASKTGQFGLGLANIAAQGRADNMALSEAVDSLSPEQKQAILAKNFPNQDFTDQDPNVFLMSTPEVQELASKGLGQPTIFETSGATQAMADLVKEQQDQYSPAIKLSQARTEAEKQAFKEGEDARVVSDVAQGDNPLWADTKEQFRQAGNTLGAYLDNPLAAGTLVGESSFDLLTGAAVGKSAIRAGMKNLVAEMGEQGAKEFVKTAAGKKVLSNAAEKASLAYVGVSEGGSNAQQTYDQIMAMKPEQFENSPEYAELIKSGLSHEQAKRKIASFAAAQTAVLAGVAGAGISKLTGAAGFEGKLFSPELLTGTGAKAAAGRVAGNMLKETGEETLQGTTGQLATNLGLQKADVTQALSEGLGSAAAESGLAGAGMGAVASTISETPKAAVDITRAGKEALGKVAAKRAESKAQQFRDTVTAADAVLAGEEAPAEAPVAQAGMKVKDANIPEEVAKAFEPIHEDDISSPDSLARIAGALQRPNLSEESRRDLAILGNNIVSAYAQALPQYEQALTNEEDPAKKAEYQQQVDTLRTMLNTPAIQNISTTAESFSMSAEQMAQVMESLPSEITPETYQTPETKKAVRAALAQMNLNSGAITPELADKLLAGAETIGLSAKDVSKLQVISSTGKAMSQVSNDVRQGSDGFMGISQYQDGIIQAVDSGNAGRANKLLAQMGKFASHMETKAQAFDDAANAWVDNPPADNQPIPVINPDTGIPFMSVNGQPMTYHPVQSKNLVQNIKNDAEVVRAAQGKLTQYAKGEPLQESETTSPPMDAGDLVPADSEAPVNDSEQAGAPIPPTTTTSAPTASEGASDANAGISSMSDEDLRWELRRLDGKSIDGLTPEEQSRVSALDAEYSLRYLKWVKENISNMSDGDLHDLGNQSGSDEIWALIDTERAKRQKDRDARFNQDVATLTDAQIREDIGVFGRKDALQTATKEESKRLAALEAEQKRRFNASKEKAPVTPSEKPPVEAVGEPAQEEEGESEAIGDVEPVARTAMPEMTEQGKLFETDTSDFKQLVQNGSSVTVTNAKTGKSKTGRPVGIDSKRDALIVRTQDGSEFKVSTSMIADGSYTITPAEQTAPATGTVSLPVEGKSATTDLNTQMDLPIEVGTNQVILDEVIPSVEAGKSKTKADIDYQATNQLAKWFTASSKKSAFLRISQFSGRIQQIFANGLNPIPQLQNLFNGFVKPEEITPHEAEVLETFALTVPQLEQLIIKSWGKLTPEGQRIFWETYHVEYFDTVREINGEKVYFLPQSVIEAMNVALLQWMGEKGRETLFNDSRAINSILGNDSKDTPSYEAYNLLQDAGVDRQDLVDYLSREVMGILGLQAKIDIPVSTKDNIANSLAMEVINSMINAGLLTTTIINTRQLADAGSTALQEEIDTAESMDQKYIPRTRVFLRANEQSAAIQAMMPLMEDSDGILGKLTNPEREGSKVYINKPPRKEATKVTNGGGQNVPEFLRKVLKKAQTQSHFINTGLNDLMFNLLGETWIENMLGISSEENANENDLKAIQGRNRTIKRDIQNYKSGVNRILNAGFELGKVPLYFAYNVAANYRNNLNSKDINPQTAKLHRELATVPASNVDFSNPAHMNFLNLAIAQGLGISIDKKSAETARAELQQQIHTGLFRDAINILKQASLTGSISEADKEVLQKAVEATEEKTKGLHALYARAQYEIAFEQGKESFTTHVMLEIDGVTNGPFNAIIQLGLADVSQELLDKLEKGGLFYGQKDKLYNERAEDPAFLDLYNSAARRTQKFIDDLMAQAKEIPARMKNLASMDKDSRKREERALRKLALSTKMTLAAYKLLGDTKIVSEGSEVQVVISRGLLKNPVTVTVYSGGAYAINRKMANHIVNGFYSQITETLRGVANSTSQEAANEIIKNLQVVIDTINELTTAHKWNPKTEQMEIIGGPINPGADPINFKFTDAQIEAITQNISVGLGAAVNDSIAQEFGTVVKRGNMMVFAANLMHEFFMVQFNREVASLENQLRAEGKLAAKESLSQAQYDDIKNYLIASMPVFNSWFTANNLDPNKMNEGILLAEGTFEVNKAYEGKSKSTAVTVSAKPTHANINARTPSYSAPGSRTMPMLVQSVEAAMQAIARTLNEHNALNVFDGYINSVEHLEAGSKAINEAVLKTWSEYNLLNDFFDRYMQGTKGQSLDSLDDAAKERMGKSLRKIAEFLGLDPHEATLDQAALGKFNEVFKKEVATQTAIQGGLFKAGVTTSINQMTGADTVTNSSGNKVITEEQAIELDAQNAGKTPLELLAEASGIAATKGTAPIQEAAIEAPVQSIGNILQRHSHEVKNHSGARVLYKKDILAALREIFGKKPTQENKIAQFILAQIEKSIPDDINVYIGSYDALSGVQAARNPDTAMKFTSSLLGLWEGQNIYIGSQSVETVMHELIHAATANLVYDFYDNMHPLTAQQKKAVAAIEKLMLKFVSQGNLEGQPSSVQQELQKLLNAGNTASAVAEFISWGLTNPKMAEVLQSKVQSGGITNILRNLAQYIAELFGIGNAPNVRSYWTRLLGNTVALVDATSPAVVRTDRPSQAQQSANNINAQTAEAVFDSLDSGTASTEHVNHLAQTLDYIQSNIQSIIKGYGVQIAGLDHYQDKLLVDSLDPDIDQSPNALIAHGFAMSDKEAYVFKLMQVSMKYALENYTASTLAARRLYAQAKESLTVKDFLTNPSDTSQPAMDLAKQRYEALFGNTVVVEQGNGASNRMANFIALAETNEQLRSKLSKIAVKDAKQKQVSTLKDRIDNWIQAALTWLSGLATKSLRQTDIASRLTVLSKNINHIESSAKDTLYGKMAHSTEALTDGIQTKLETVGNAVRDQLLKVEKKVPKSVAFGITAGMAVFNKQDAADVREAIKNIYMSASQGGQKLNAVAELINEFMGAGNDTASLYDLLGRKKNAVDTARQLIRESVPKMLEKAFSSLTPNDKSSIHETVGITDMAYLYANGYDLARLEELVSNPHELAREIDRMETQLKALPNGHFYLKQAHGLASTMVHGVSPLAMQLPNAEAIARLLGTDRALPDAQVIATASELVDTLASLSALDLVSADKKAAVSEVMKREISKGGTDGNGMTFTLDYYRRLQQDELSSTANGKSLGAAKGYAPIITDPNKNVIIASEDDAAELKKRGYTKGAHVARSSNDPASNLAGDLYYFHADNGGRPRWVSGIMGTIQTTVGGANPNTGRSMDGSYVPGVWNPKGRYQVAKANKAAIDMMFDPSVGMPSGKYTALQPVMNQAGTIVGYSYQIPRVIKEAHLDVDNDFTKVLAAWEGHIAEQTLAKKFNADLLKMMKQQFEDDARQGNAYQYTTISKNSQDEQLAEIWTLMPDDMKAEAKKLFKNGEIKVRKDLLNNAFGYRAPSILEMWTRKSKAAKQWQGAFEQIAETFIGKNAMRYLRLGERGLMELVSAAKNWIIVKSVVVATVNILSNLNHAISLGMNPVRMVKDISIAVIAAEEYRKNEKEISELMHYLILGHNASKAEEYKARISELRDEQARNPVTDLIKAGMLPTVAEDLGQQDDYSLMDKLFDKMNGIFDKVPDSVKTVASEVTFSRNSHIYYLLNRGVQYGDFASKYAVYQHLTKYSKTPMDKQSAMNKIRDEFVNYDILPSRTRYYLDAIGLTWFLNYKIRIQKIILRTIRENPVRGLLMMLGSGLPLPSDANLVTGSLDYNLGISPLFSAPGTHPIIAAM